MPLADIMVTTLGGTWAIIPELVGFTNPGLLDLYSLHPHRGQIEEERKDIRPVEEIWLITTKGKLTENALEKIREWHRLSDPDHQILFRTWQLSVMDLSSPDECKKMRECIYRVVSLAVQRSGHGQLLISLAGGRKTMSTDIQNAASYFGCHALLHVVQDEMYSARLREYGVRDFTHPLPEDMKGAVTPLVAGHYPPNPLFDMKDAQQALLSDMMPIPQVNGMSEIEINDFSLTEHIQARLDRAGFLFSNYTNSLMQEDNSSNFLALYHLPPKDIERLKHIHFGVIPEKGNWERKWLQRLPKTELHCHLGGIADVHGLIEIAESNHEGLYRYREQLSGWLNQWRERLEKEDPDRIREGLRPKDMRRAVAGVPEPYCVAAFILLFREDPELLDEIIYGKYRDEARFCKTGFDIYEGLGDFQGSGLLQSEASIRTAVRLLRDMAHEHNIRYMEIRCSPANYTRGGLTSREVVDLICDELKKDDTVQYSILFTASRHGRMSRIYEHIELASDLFEQEPNNRHLLFRGFDLAGNEKAARPADLRQAFLDLQKRCIHFTIHAGETEKAESIWEAVYHLNAERIGHGLTLGQDPSLMSNLMDRNVAIEMCPSSNFQIIGFRDNHIPQTEGLETYPLKEYLKRGLRVTVNTDNPGISRTNFTKELHRAARLTPGGLSIWDILRLIRNGFKAAFQERSLRHQMILSAEADILKIIEDSKEDLIKENRG